MTPGPGTYDPPVPGSTPDELATVAGFLFALVILLVWASVLVKDWHNGRRKD